MRKIKLLAEAFFHFNIYLGRVLSVLKNGQSSTYDIMQLAHRLEKGLINANPKPMWGWEKAERLAYLLFTNKDCVSFQTGLSVLQAFISAKKMSPEEGQLAIKLESKYNFVESNVPGGAIYLERVTFTDSETQIIEEFVRTRHSTRNFDSKELEYDKVQKAIELAMRCPSACNRQPFKVYLVPDNVRSEKIGVKCESAASLYITGVVDAYNFTELMDWIVSPSIFAAYLSLTLHCYGIGSCIYKKELIRRDDYNDKVSKACSIPDNEQLILEIRIGMYPKTVSAAVSNRLPLDNCLTIIK